MLLISFFKGMMFDLHHRNSLIKVDWERSRRLWPAFSDVNIKIILDPQANIRKLCLLNLMQQLIVEYLLELSSVPTALQGTPTVRKRCHDSLAWKGQEQGKRSEELTCIEPSYLRALFVFWSYFSEQPSECGRRHVNWQATDLGRFWEGGRIWTEINELRFSGSEGHHHCLRSLFRPWMNLQASLRPSEMETGASVFVMGTLVQTRLTLPLP